MPHTSHLGSHRVRHAGDAAGAVKGQEDSVPHVPIWQPAEFELHSERLAGDPIHDREQRATIGE